MTFRSFSFKWDDSYGENLNQIMPVLKIFQIPSSLESNNTAGIQSLFIRIGGDQIKVIVFFSIFSIRLHFYSNSDIQIFPNRRSCSPDEGNML